MTKDNFILLFSIVFLIFASISCSDKKVVLETGEILEGTFNDKNELINGKIITPSGVVSVGTFDGKGRLLEGELTTKNGIVAKGKFGDTGNLIEGSLSAPNGVIIEGTFNPNTGEPIDGKMTSSDGEVSLFKDGVKVID